MQPGQKITRLQGLGIAVLRVVTGYLFLASGAYKLFIADLTLNQQAADSLSGPIVLVSSVGELVCGAALMVGLLTRFVCIPLILLMLANILVMHPPYQLFGQEHSFEYALLRLAASTALALTGSGRVALDNILARMNKPQRYRLSWGRKPFWYATQNMQVEPHINLLQDLCTSSEGAKHLKYTAYYVDPSDHTNNITEQAYSPTEALEPLYEALEHRGISRDTLPRPRLL